MSHNLWQNHSYLTANRFLCVKYHSLLCHRAWLGNNRYLNLIELDCRIGFSLRVTLKVFYLMLIGQRIRWALGAKNIKLKTSLREKFLRSCFSIIYQLSLFEFLTIVYDLMDLSITLNDLSWTHNSFLEIPWFLIDTKPISFAANENFRAASMASGESKSLIRLEMSIHGTSGQLYE